MSWKSVTHFSLPPYDTVVKPNEENLRLSNSFALIFLLYEITICVAMFKQIYLFLLMINLDGYFSTPILILELESDDGLQGMFINIQLTPI